MGIANSFLDRGHCEGNCRVGPRSAEIRGHGQDAALLFCNVVGYFDASELNPCPKNGPQKKQHASTIALPKTNDTRVFDWSC